jgi:predicted regulator of Ras-like GTPase activity (Roadblock/LC7/MglB family)
VFLERLAQVAGRIEGTLALCLVAKDGIPIEAVNYASDVDLDVLAAEMVAQARSISNDHRELAVGELQQFSVTTDRLTLMVSSLAGGYYLLLVLGPHGNYGRARFELRRARLLLDEDLA